MRMATENEGKIITKVKSLNTSPDKRGKVDE